jgi:hypothetical protein
MTTLSAQSYDFTELRYSDAIGKFTQLEGKITFKPEGLDIEYPKSKRALEYDGEDIIFYENEKERELPSAQASQMARYFDILKLLHEGDASELEENFEVKEKDGQTLLKPKGAIKYYIEHIELIKENKELKYVKLFLKNSDYITINISNEIH